MWIAHGIGIAEEVSAGIAVGTSEGIQNKPPNESHNELPENRIPVLEEMYGETAEHVSITF